MKFKLWLENNNLVPISTLLMSKSEIFEAVSNITRGSPSMTEGPVKVVYFKKAKKYQLVNGYHRVVEHIVRGEENIAIMIGDEDTSDWKLPSRKDTFIYQNDLPYKGLESFIEPYLLKRL